MCERVTAHARKISHFIHSSQRAGMLNPVKWTGPIALYIKLGPVEDQQLQLNMGYPAIFLDGK